MSHCALSSPGQRSNPKQPLPGDDRVTHSHVCLFVAPQPLFTSASVCSFHYGQDFDMDAKILIYFGVYAAALASSCHSILVQKFNSDIQDTARSGTKLCRGPLASVVC